MITDNTKVIVSFTAPAWCNPCKQFEPHWKQASERTEEALFVKVVMGDTPEATFDHWASEEYAVLGVPTVKLFEGGEVVDIRARTVVGLLNEVG